ncbi:uncharacterized protein EV422DRAFT_508804 [Fimicolochytrium jonesii]|uniref:uncharacterized protein n=1 Tax=Fimicolochytrium jonesii TaxID=1396493 RepID=UPI0022FDBB5B|nr:uncharacterized protein EV422DRAFT_508804 [Fimicolochytrium jonesii]KAI8817736.1 hypothetical protein EV422DRAFT_508804 [Fimicolochytrium jonesii]
MYTRKYIPLLSGILLPMATLFNTQSIIVPGWLYHERSAHWGTHEIVSSASSILTNRPHRPRLQFYTLPLVTALASASLGLGLLAVGCLFLRMLEKKIKWCTRLLILGAAGQGIFAFAAVITFWSWVSLSNTDGQYSEGSFYSAICGFLSLAVAGLNAYHHHMNRMQVYSYTLYELSVAQRQLVLLTITTIVYIVAMGALYATLEGWEFDDGLYWCAATLSTIGFGDLYPQTVLGKLLLPIMATAGVALLTATVYAIRQVALELLTHQLATEYSKSFGIQKEDASMDVPGGVGAGVPFGRRRTVDVAVTRSHPNLWSGGRETSDGMLGERGRGATVAVPQEIPQSDRDIYTGSRAAFSAPHGVVTDLFPPLSPSKQPDLARLSVPDMRMNTQTPSRHFENDNGAGVPFTHSVTTPTPTRSRTMVISRGAHLPQVTIQTTHHVRRHHVVEATRRTFRHQITSALIAVIANMLIFGGLFAFFEHWAFFEGMYFVVCALLTIGYGDYTLTTVQSRSVFVWFLFIGIASVAYLFSLLSERALDQWTMEVGKIASRVDRYERKARLKKMYRKGDVWAAGKTRKRDEGGRGDVGERHPFVSTDSDVSMEDHRDVDSDEYHDDQPAWSEHEAGAGHDGYTTQENENVDTQLIWDNDVPQHRCGSPLDLTPDLQPTSPPPPPEIGLFTTSEAEDSETTPLLIPPPTPPTPSSTSSSLHPPSILGSRQTQRNNPLSSSVHFDHSPTRYAPTSPTSPISSLSRSYVQPQPHRRTRSYAVPIRRHGSVDVPHTQGLGRHGATTYDRRVESHVQVSRSYVPTRNVVRLEMPADQSNLLSVDGGGDGGVGVRRRASVSVSLRRPSTVRSIHDAEGYLQPAPFAEDGDGYYDSDEDECREGDVYSTTPAVRMFSGRVSERRGSVRSVAVAVPVEVPVERVEGGEEVMDGDRNAEPGEGGVSGCIGIDVDEDDGRATF